jgi:DNA-binding SARP family transcriptional activator
MSIQGNVTLSLADYHKLIEQQPRAEESLKNLYEASKEIEVFLSFLVTREDIEDYVVEFNRQALHSTIEVVDGRAKIKFKDEITDNKS